MFLRGLRSTLFSSPSLFPSPGVFASYGAARCYSTKIITLKFPKLAESISEGTFSKWLKKPNEQCEADETLGSIFTDKVTADVKAPEAGVIRDVFVQENQNIVVDQDLCTFEIGAKGSQAQAAPEPTKAPTPTPTSAPTPAPAAAAPAPTPATPPPPPPKAAAPAPTKPAAPKISAPQVTSGARTERREPLSRMRQRIADRLKGSQNTYAMLTTFQEADMSNLIQLRDQLKDDFLKKHGVKLGFMSAFVKASANALREQPIVNAVLDGTDIVYRDFVDISVAVATPTGLVVPVLRDCDRLSFADVEKTIADYGNKAREGKIAIEDMAGGTFTISNGGVYGSMMGTPILNPPQSAILGMHGITKRAVVVENDRIEARPVMYLALTYDHRLIDGRDAVTFLRRIKFQIEDPRRMLLNL